MTPNNDRIKIALLTTGDPTDRRSWSGIDYYMSQALQKHCGDVYYLGPLNPWLRLTFGKIINKSTSLIMKRHYAYLHSFLLAKGYAMRIRRMLAGSPMDLLFVPSAAPTAAFLDTKTPMAYLSGTTFALMKSYYPQFSSLLQLSVKEGHAIEQSVIDKSSVLLYPTEWPARSAVDDYGADPSKIHIVPYGANLDKEDLPDEADMLGSRKSDRCKLLFVGVDWQRKGGPIAYEALLRLLNSGIDAELTVCGCVPPRQFMHDRMKVIPFLDKNDPNQRHEMGELFLHSDFLLVPTRSECFGVVFCEASAFGLPSVTTHTGGVPGVVVDGENGHMLPLNAGGNEYAELIAEIYQDKARYTELVRSSRRAFDDRLNWDAWGSKVGKALRSIAGG